MRILWLSIFWALSFNADAEGFNTPIISSDGKYVLESDSLFNTRDIQYFNLYPTNEEGFVIPVAMKNDSIYLFEKTKYTEFRHPTSDHKTINGPWIRKQDFYINFKLNLKTVPQNNFYCSTENLESVHPTKVMLADATPYIESADSTDYAFQKIQYRITCNNIIIFSDTLTTSNDKMICDNQQTLQVFLSENKEYYFVSVTVSWYQDFGENYSTINSKQFRRLKKNNH